MYPVLTFRHEFLILSHDCFSEGFCFGCLTIICVILRVYIFISILRYVSINVLSSLFLLFFYHLISAHTSPH